MPQARRSLSGRMAVLLIVYALLLLVCVALYFFITNRLAASVARMAAGEVGREVVIAELSRLVAIMLGCFLAILAFAIGAYTFIGIGRAISRPTASGKPTKYVDAWSQYRISEEQIRAATEEVDDRNATEDPSSGRDDDDPS
ncbi:MAG: hypothetical protein KBH81_07775 [Phycisphaerae bacterium]|jgi:hypothetical protein|nr:hypothetical protein [Phycisphaerae bacterium]HOO15690.1 hypothetical protein [Phycisphaerae bacterium]HPC21843.1 hypothetical protein [Phycisphaerae bacterium]HRS26940.1 hypothetical protein [Phycisphaerae bacterium]HRT40939.1 hypothetical protein [Phycisphaerae bacterium]